MKVDSLANNPHLKAVRHINQLVSDLTNLDTLTNSNAEERELDELLSLAGELQTKLSVHVMLWTTRSLESGIEIDSELAYKSEVEGW